MSMILCTSTQKLPAVAWFILAGPRVVHPSFGIDLLDVLSEQSWQLLSRDSCAADRSRVALLIAFCGRGLFFEGSLVAGFTTGLRYAILL